MSQNETLSLSLPWKLELVEKLPFGFKIIDAKGECIVSAVGAATSSKQKTRADYLDGVGFKWGVGGDFDRDDAIKTVALQEAAAEYMVASANACEGASSATLKRGLLAETAVNVMEMQMQLTALREFAITIKDFVQSYPHDTGLHDTAVVALRKLGVQP